MDFMKVLDQTVREIRREVNLKVLKVPEMEQKVLDATSNEPWGPHGSALSEIAQATKKLTECQMIMNVLWTRLTDTGPNWRHAYKALAVIEYLVSNGSEHALDDILEHTFQISSISGFEYIEPNGKDVGINVRKKVETILAVLNDKEKIKAVRDKAAANRDKYIGLSSAGVTYKSSSKSYGSGDIHHVDRYGDIGGPREGDSFKESYKDTERYGEETDRNFVNKNSPSKSSDTFGNKHEENKFDKGGHARDQDALPSSTSKPLNKPASNPSAKSSSTQPISSEDDFDDFNPRGSSTAGYVGTDSKQVDLLGQSLLIDLMDAPACLPTETSTMNNSSTPETDLFADATFVSASSHAAEAGGSHSQGNFDFFANQPNLPATYTSSFNLFEGADSSFPPETETSKTEPANNSAFDPFAAVPLDNFEGSDFFGAFTSHSDPVVTEPSQNSTENKLNNMDQTSSIATKPVPKKDTFLVKSGIWADSLSRGLIDLNITAPKKTSLADIGVVGGLGDGSDEKGPTFSTNMGRAMGARSGLVGSGFASTTVKGNGSITNLGQQQFGSFK